MGICSTAAQWGSTVQQLRCDQMSNQLRFVFPLSSFLYRYMVDEMNVLIYGGAKQCYHGYNINVSSNIFVRPDLGCGRTFCMENGEQCSIDSSVVLTAV